MIAVRAVSDFEAQNDDQITVKEGQLFYVLSVTDDDRRYYLSSSARVPFSRVARSGFAPVPLFVVVGDTLPKELRPKVQTIRVPPQQQQQQSQEIPAPGSVHPRAENRRAMPPGVSPKRNNSLKSLAAAAARSLLGGIPGRTASTSSSSSSSSSSGSMLAPPALIEKSGPPVPKKGVVSLVRAAHFKRLSTPAAPPSTPDSVPVDAAILNFRHGGDKTIEYTVRFSLADGQEMTVRRSHAEFKSMHDKIRPEYLERLPVLPEPAAIAADTVGARACSQQLNGYLRAVVRLHNQLLASRGASSNSVGLPLNDLVFCEASDRLTDPEPAGGIPGSDVAAATAATAAAPAESKISVVVCPPSSSPKASQPSDDGGGAAHKYFYFGSPTDSAALAAAATTEVRRSSADSGFASLPATRKNSVAADEDTAFTGAAPADGKSLAPPLVSERTAAVFGFRGAVTRGFSTELVSRLEGLASTPTSRP